MGKNDVVLPGPAIGRNKADANRRRPFFSTKRRIEREEFRAEFWAPTQINGPVRVFRLNERTTQ